MSQSDFLVGFLSPDTQRVYAENKAEEKPQGAPPELALLKKISNVVFGPSVKTLDQARERFNTIVESLDDDESGNNG